MAESDDPRTLTEVLDRVEPAMIDLYGAACRFREATEMLPLSRRLESGRAGLTAKALRLQAQTLELLQEVDALRQIKGAKYGVGGVVVDVDKESDALKRRPIGFINKDKSDHNAEDVG